MSPSTCPCPWPCRHAPRNVPLFQHSRSVSWERDEVLWEAGSEATFVLAVCTGAVGLRSGAETPRRLAGLVLRGEVAGEEAAAGSPRASAAVGLLPGKGRLLERSVLTRVAEPPQWATLLSTSAARLGGLTEQLRAVTHDSVAVRLARLFEDLGERAGLEDARGVMIPLPLLRRDLAELVGCREETVVRHMRTWERAGALLTTREGFILADPAGLLAPG